MFESILKNMSINMPLVHCITNYVTVNDCANIILACGGSPIMADDEKEVEEIISLCHSLYINIGTLNSRTIESMRKAGIIANQLKKPVVFDPVGAGASTLRTYTTLQLLREVECAVIRGNISEIKTIAYGDGKTKGVDASVDDIITEDNLNHTIAFAKKLSAETNAIIAITGKIDIVASKDKAFIVRNGHPMMSKVTGTGCMLTAIIATFCGANPTSILDATVTAVAFMGICGERAFAKGNISGIGTSSFRNFLIDEASTFTEEIFERGMKIEAR